jgi:outer membrane immunogenic protein
MGAPPLDRSRSTAELVACRRIWSNVMSFNNKNQSIARSLAVGVAIVAATASVASMANAAEVSRWEGPYVGIQVGPTNLSGDYQATTGSCGPCSLVNLDSDGTAVGGQVGYNFQAGRYVFGLEASLASADMSEISDQVVVGGVLSTRPEFTRELDWTATITPRGGVLVHNTLVYAKAGWAYASTTVGHFTGGGGTYQSQSDTRTGWVVGAGLEHPFSDHLTGSVEVNHMDFGSERAQFSAFSIDHELIVQSVRFGLNYQF